MRYCDMGGVEIPVAKEVPMPETTVVFYAQDDGTAPLLTWLDRQQSKVVPDTDIDLAITRKAKFTRDPQKHTCTE